MTEILDVTQQNISLKSMNTLGIEAKARYFARIQTVETLKTLLKQAEFKALQKFILGGGSNVLFIKDFDGLVIQNNLKGIQVVKEDAEHIYVKAYAGENWHDFVLYCIEQNYAGIENLSLIPGTVGAAPIQNIGAYGVELQDVFHELEACHIDSLETKTFHKTDCQFAYRDSIFKNTCKNQFIILSLTLRLNKKPNFHLEYGALKETLDAMNVKEINLQSISNAVINIRRSKLPDPKDIGNAGSFFKNPIITIEQFTTLKKSFPTLPSFPTENKNTIKIPAAWLIEQCGFKGKRFGEVGVHQNHALILVNYGKGTGRDIYDLAMNIQSTVQQQFGILLNPEVNFI